MTGYILDTSVWIDFLRGTRPAGVARGYLLSSDPGPLISSIELGELIKVYLEQGFDDESFFEDLALVHSWCDIVDVN